MNVGCGREKWWLLERSVNDQERRTLSSLWLNLVRHLAFREFALSLWECLLTPERLLGSGYAGILIALAHRLTQRKYTLSAKALQCSGSQSSQPQICGRVGVEPIVEDQSIRSDNPTSRSRAATDSISGVRSRPLTVQRSPDPHVRPPASSIPLSRNLAQPGRRLDRVCVTGVRSTVHARDWNGHNQCDRRGRLWSC